MASSKKKDLAGKDKEPQVRGRSGPASATRNERAQGRKGKGARAVPKVGKHDSGEGRSQGEGLH
ncbi:MAG TPA: hypothetical protein VM936_19265 [Pyrinomonadaceae bacterium]|jgi:hypothetical protein|nr:hypothetical protein [Pyrinomonadaceae bacterium]